LQKIYALYGNTRDKPQNRLHKKGRKMKKAFLRGDTGLKDSVEERKSCPLHKGMERKEQE